MEKSVEMEKKAHSHQPATKTVHTTNKRANQPFNEIETAKRDRKSKMRRKRHKQKRRRGTKKRRVEATIR